MNELAGRSGKPLLSLDPIEFSAFSASFEVKGFEPLIVVSKTNVLPLDYTSLPYLAGIQDAPRNKGAERFIWRMLCLL